MMMIVSLSVNLCGMTEKIKSCFFRPMYYLSEMYALNEEWINSISAYDGLVSTIVMTQPGYNKDAGMFIESVFTDESFL
jgi:hypothetical protein